jgi:hypothetical protein
MSLRRFATARVMAAPGFGLVRGRVACSPHRFLVRSPWMPRSCRKTDAGAGSARAHVSGRELLALMLMTTLSFAACSGDGGSPASAGPEGPAESPAVVSEARALKVGTHSREMGQECAGGGGSDCASGVCLQTPHAVSAAADRAGAYVCSALCQHARDCAEGWTCVQVTPGQATSLCVPPKGWTPRAAQLHPRTKRGNP